MRDEDGMTNRDAAIATGLAALLIALAVALYWLPLTGWLGRWAPALRTSEDIASLNRFSSLVQRASNCIAEAADCVPESRAALT